VDRHGRGETSAVERKRNKFRASSTGCPRKNSAGVLVINISSLPSHTIFLLTKTIRPSLQVLLPFSAIQREHH
jgi:hypothetical protein